MIGEPSGTAGAPMLNILQKNNLCNALIIFTRYFGGILLGTGGLVRCYSAGCLGAIEKVETIEIELGFEMTITLDYSDFQNVQYYFGKKGINILDSKYENDIERLKQNIERLENEKQKYESQSISSNEWIEKFKEQKGITELSRDIMMELIDCIYVHENGNITIKFKFEDEFKRCQEYIENNKNVLLKQVASL